MLSGIHAIQKIKQMYLLFLTNTFLTNVFVRNRLTDTENKLEVTREEKKGNRGEIGERD